MKKESVINAAITDFKRFSGDDPKMRRMAYMVRATLQWARGDRFNLMEEFLENLKLLRQEK